MSKKPKPDNRAPDTLTIKPAPDVRRALDEIATREHTTPETLASELIRGALGMAT